MLKQTTSLYSIEAGSRIVPPKGVKEDKKPMIVVINTLKINLVLFDSMASYQINKKIIYM